MFLLSLTSCQCGSKRTGSNVRKNVRQYVKLYPFYAICRASARQPAFLSTTPHIPSSLEGMGSRKALKGYRLLNVANDLG